MATQSSAGEYELKFDYAHCPSIKKFSESDAFIRAIMGPFGSGKSSGCVIEIFRRAMKQAPSADGIRRTRWAIVRNSYPQLRDTSIKTFMDWFPPKHFGRWRAVEHQYLMKWADVECEVLFRALDKPSDVGNLLSMELTGAMLNECREIPEAIFTAIQGRVGRFPAKKDGGCTWAGIIMDTNPPHDGSWFYKLFEEIRPENAELFKQPSGLSAEAENIENLPKHYYTNLALGKDPEFVKVYVDGNYGFIMEGRPVYPEWNDTTHVGKFDPIEGVIIRRGWDFGLTPACVLTQMAPNGQWRILDEIIANNVGVSRFSERVINFCANKYQGYDFIDIGDPAGQSRSQVDERTCFQILRARGINIEAGVQDPGIRVESVKKALNTMVDGEPGFLLHQRCKHLRRGFRGGYRYRKMQIGGSSERYQDKPEKNEYSHVHDALQYDATKLFGYTLLTPQDDKYSSRRSRRRRWGFNSWMAA